MSTILHPVVLLAEDDFLIRLAALDFLEHDGFEVIEACDGAAALTVMRGNSNIQLLFSDINMPNLDCVGLAREARRLRPGMGILLTSGQPRPDHLPAGAVFMEKPYSHTATTAALRNLLAA